MLKIIYLIGALINLCILIKVLYSKYKRSLPITLGDLYFTLCCCILSVLVTPILILGLTVKIILYLIRKNEK